MIRKKTKPTNWESTLAFIRGMIYGAIICVVIGGLFVLGRRLYSITNIETVLAAIGAICIVFGYGYSEMGSEIEKYKEDTDED